MGLNTTITVPKIEKWISRGEGDEYRMIELGNQHLDQHLGGPHGSAKDYFLAKDIDHVSIDLNGQDGIDLNGQDGALKLDLNTKLDIAPADIITNAGTSEHVSNQEMCFTNVHNLCKVGGHMVHFIPPQGTWPGHCSHYYSTEFMSDLAEANNYTLLENRLLDEGRYVNKLNLIYCVLNKTEDSEFSWPN